MRPTACHDILRLTDNVTVSDTERRVWNKLMIECANIKLKFTKIKLSINLLEKLRVRNLGTNSVEVYVKGFRSEQSKSKVRRSCLRGMISDLVHDEMRARRYFDRKFRYVKSRWGHYCQIFASFQSIMNTEV